MDELSDDGQELADQLFRELNGIARYMGGRYMTEGVDEYCVLVALGAMYTSILEGWKELGKREEAEQLQRRSAILAEVAMQHARAKLAGDGINQESLEQMSEAEKLELATRSFEELKQAMTAVN